MLTVTHDLWPQPDQSSRPHLECLRAADASSLAHQVTNNSPHSFHRAGGSGQVQMRILAIGSELVSPPQKLPHHHADTGRTARLTGHFFQTLKDPLELGTIGKLQCLTGELVAKFTHVSACDFSLSPSPVALQLADKVKMTQLQDPAFVHGQGGDTPDLVGHQGPNTLVQSYRDGVDGFRPATDFFPTRKKQRVQKDRTVLVTGFQPHQVQDPGTSVETKVKPVDQKDQWSCWHTQGARSGHELVHGLTKTVAQGLRSKARARSKTFQRPSLQQHCLQESGRSSPRLAASFFSANSPGVLAMAALTTPRAKAVNFGSTTGRFRVQSLHARELCVYRLLKYGKSQANFA